jgi:hypothetical protein
MKIIRDTFRIIVLFAIGMFIYDTNIGVGNSIILTLLILVYGLLSFQAGLEV